ncbi:hypothetical protein PoB_000544700 [Plakobranchus ocellatus]|uniref:SEA domain-containing protein n=1 Tax=Plakobranchus ocellatus TaxID=259542 RepID=A0AAV3Y8Y8_9GAST|nr:hypothetical protein PoB_000544700 [Plakobranchus ocellatus]
MSSMSTEQVTANSTEAPMSSMSTPTAAVSDSTQSSTAQSESPTTQSSTAQSESPTTQSSTEATTVAVLTIRGKVVIVDGYTWSDVLLDMTNTETRDLKDYMEDTVLRLVYSNLNGYQNVVVVQFSQGSVEVIYDIIFDKSSTVTPDELTDTMKSYLSQNNNKLGTYTVDADSVEHSEVKADDDDDDDDDLEAWMIAVIVCGGVLVLFIICIIICVCSRKSTPNQRYVLDEEAEEMRYKRSWTTGSHDNGSSSSRSQSEFAAYENIGHDGPKQPMSEAAIEEIPMPLAESAQPVNGRNTGGGAYESIGKKPEEEHAYSKVGEGYVNPAFADPECKTNGYDLPISNGNGKVPQTGIPGVVTSKKEIVYQNGGTWTFYDIDADAWETRL